MVVTMHKHVISRIPRYSISVSDKNTWILHVTRVQQEDRGYYMCQVNTNPIMSQVGYLQVTGKFNKNFIQKILLNNCQKERRDSHIFPQTVSLPVV